MWHHWWSPVQKPTYLIKTSAATQIQVCCDTTLDLWREIKPAATFMYAFVGF